MELEYTFYPGCALEASSAHYGDSVDAVCDRLGVKLHELEDWNCCGATAYLSVRELESFALAARNLALAEPLGRDLVTVCSGCYVTLNKASEFLREASGEARQRIIDALNSAGLTYRGTIRTRHLLDVMFNDVGLGAITEAVSNPLSELKVACYYGCQIVRPFTDFDNPEVPSTLDSLTKALGAQVVEWPGRVTCCGGMIMSTQPPVSERLVGTILDHALRAGADCIVTVCPLCYVNLEAYQDRASQAIGKTLYIPVLFFTQLMGLAMGMSPKQLGMHRALVDPSKVVQLATKKVGVGA